MLKLRQLHEVVLPGDAKAARTVAEIPLAPGIESLELVQEFLMPDKRRITFQLHAGREDTKASFQGHRGLCA